MQLRPLGWTIGIALVSCAAFLGGSEIPEEARRQKNPQSATEQSLAIGKQLYEKYCQSCHGDQGSGDGPAAELFDEKPKPINSPERMKSVSDGELFWRISVGKTPMPAFEKKLSAEERWHIVNYVRTFSKTTGSK